MKTVDNYKKSLSESPKCPHCGASMAIHQHTLGKGLLDTFLLFSRAIKMSMTSSIHLQKQLPLDKNQYNNFQKLRYFSLVSKDTVRSGYWSITEKGLDFIANRIAISISVKTFRNKIVESSNDKGFVNDLITGYSKEYWQKEFPYQIKMSKIVPMESEQVSMF